MHVAPVQAQAAPQAAAQAGKQQSEGSAFPPMTGDDVQRYQGMFAKLDTDRDGYVMVGPHCDSNALVSVAQDPCWYPGRSR